MSHHCDLSQPCVMRELRARQRARAAREAAWRESETARYSSPAIASNIPVRSSTGLIARNIPVSCSRWRQPAALTEQQVLERLQFSLVQPLEVKADKTLTLAGK